MEVADADPSAVVRGFDLYPPPNVWVPPNCKLEVDDALKPWMFDTKFELVHMRRALPYSPSFLWCCMLGQS